MNTPPLKSREESSADLAANIKRLVEILANSCAMPVLNCALISADRMSLHAEVDRLASLASPSVAPDPVRAALVELVALQDLKVLVLSVDGQGEGWSLADAEHDYARRKPLAWSAARAAVAVPTVPQLHTPRGACVQPEFFAHLTEPLSQPQQNAGGSQALADSALCEQIESLNAALMTIRDMPLEEQDNMVSANMRTIAGNALAPMGEINEADRVWAAAMIMGQACELSAKRIDYIAELVVKGMPDGLRGFCKVWGWQQFARALLKIVPTADESLALLSDARAGLDDIRGIASLHLSAIDAAMGATPPIPPQQSSGPTSDGVEA